jgi:seryl-tRNA synthetase
MADQNDSAQIVISAKNLTAEGFAQVSKALKQLENDSKRTTSDGEASWSKWFATISGGVAVGNLLSSAFQQAGSLLAQIPGQLIALGAHGADVADVQTHFQRLNAEIGNGPGVLRALTTSTAGTIAKFDLMKAANTALSDGVRLTETQFGTLGRASRVLADATGGDTKEAFNTLLDVMESGRTKALKNIGITIDQSKAYGDYAKAVHKSADDLSEHEQKVATQNAVLKSLEAMLHKTGDAQDDFADAVNRGKATFQNFTDDLAVGIANSPVFAAALGGVQEAIDHAFGGNSQALITAIVGFLEDAAIHAADFAQVGISVAGVVGQAFSGLKFVFAGVMGDLTGLAGVFNGALASVYEAASKVPGVGSQFKGLAGLFRDASDQAKGMSASFRDQQHEAYQGLLGNSAYQKTLDGVSAGIQTVRDKMVAAKNAKQDDVKATNDAAGAAKNHAGASGEEAEYSKKAAEAAAKHAAEIKKLAEGLSGGAVLKGIKDFNEALALEKVNLERMPIEALDKLNKAVEAGIDLYRRRGQAAPEALRIESLAIKAALEEARRAEAEYQKMHGPILLKAAPGIDLMHIPTATDQRGNPFASAVQTTLGSRDLSSASTDSATYKLTQDLVRGVNVADVKKQIAQKFAVAGFWKGTFGSPQALGGELSSTIIGAIQGGGNPLSAAGGLLGGKLGTGIASSLTGKLTDVGSGLFSKALGGVLNSAIPVVGSLVGPLAGALWNHLFGSAGRDAVKKFAESMGGFDDLHTKLGALGAQGEQLWIKLTQGVGKNNPEQAKKVIGEINDALAHIPPTMAEAAAQAGFQTTASLTQASSDAVKLWEYMRDSGSYTADQVQQAWEKAQEALRNSGDASASALQKSYDAASGQLKALDDEIASLQKSIDSEAPEAVMGVVEAQARARLAALQKERDAAAKHVEEIQTQLQQSMDRVATALENLPHELDVHVRTHFDDDGNSHEPPRHATGAYIRQDHVAQVHGGEIVGPIDFMTRALVGAFQSLSPSGTRAQASAHGQCRRRCRRRKPS